MWSILATHLVYVVQRLLFEFHHFIELYLASVKVLLNAAFAFCKRGYQTSILLHESLKCKIQLLQLMIMGCSSGYTVIGTQLLGQ